MRGGCGGVRSAGCSASTPVPRGRPATRQVEVFLAYASPRGRALGTAVDWVTVSYRCNGWRELGDVTVALTDQGGHDVINSREALSRRRRQVAGRAASSQPRASSAGQRFIKRPAAWVIGGIVAAASVILVSILTSIPAQIVDIRALGDLLRIGDDIRVTTDIVNDDGNYTMAVPGRYDLSLEDPLRREVDVESALSFVQRTRDAGGYDVDRLRVRVVLEGRRNQQIQITDLALSDVQTMEAVGGTLLTLHSEGDSDNQQIVYDLSDPLPRARELREDGSLGDFYFKNNTISLIDGEQVVVLAQFNAKPSTATEFTLRLRYSMGGGARSMVIDNDGLPFKVTSVSCREPDTYYSAYDHAYIMEATDRGYGLVLAPDSHHISAGLYCPTA